MLAIRNTVRTSQIVVVVSIVDKPGGVGVQRIDDNVIMVSTGGRLAGRLAGFSASVRRPTIPSIRSWVFSAKPYVCVLILSMQHTRETNIKKTTLAFSVRFVIVILDVAIDEAEVAI